MELPEGGCFQIYIQDDAFDSSAAIFLGWGKRSSILLGCSSRLFLQDWCVISASWNGFMFFLAGCHLQLPKKHGTNRPFGHPKMPKNQNLGGLKHIKPPTCGGFSMFFLLVLPWAFGRIFF